MARDRRERDKAKSIEKVTGLQWTEARDRVVTSQDKQMSIRREKRETSRSKPPLLSARRSSAATHITKVRRWSVHDWADDCVAWRLDLELCQDTDVTVGGNDISVAIYLALVI